MKLRNQLKNIINLLNKILSNIYNIIIIKLLLEVKKK